MLDTKIYTFLKVAELKNFTKAAEELGLTQPAVSQHIAKLEDYYQQKLIQTQNKKVILTDAGLLMYNYAKQQVNNEHQLIQQFQNIKTKLHIGATLSIADYYLPQIMSEYLKQNAIELEITVNNTASLLKQMIDGKLDAAFIEGMFDHHQFDCMKYYTEDFYPVVSMNHPLVHQTVSIEDLFNYPLILREKGSGTRHILDTYLFQQNYSSENFQYVYEFGSFVMIKELLMKSNAISFMYSRVAKKEVDEGKLAFLDIQDYDLKHSFYFVYPKNILLKKQIVDFYNAIEKGR